jgi:hypothetical protein
VDTYDVQTVVLNEMGHVNTLGHHDNPSYADAAVQADPRAYSQTYWKRRSLACADNAALLARFGPRSTEPPPCWPPPCPEVPQP